MQQQQAEIAVAWLKRGADAICIHDEYHRPSLLCEKPPLLFEKKKPPP